MRRAKKKGRSYGCDPSILFCRLFATTKHRASPHRGGSWNLGAFEDLGNRVGCCSYQGGYDAGEDQQQASCGKRK